MSIEEAWQQTQAEKLTLLVAESKTGYFGVNLSKPGTPKPYQAQVRCGGKKVHLGYFATAKEAALGIARSPEGQAVAAERAAAAVLPLTGEEARQQAQVEGLTLRVAESKTGYFGVAHRPHNSKPYQARVNPCGKDVSLGYFATAEEAALCVARSPAGGSAVAARRAAALTSEEARQQAQAEGLTLRVAKNTAGYFGVILANPGRPKAYQAQMRRGDKIVHLGCFATAEEAALSVARSPLCWVCVGSVQASAGRVAAADSQGTHPPSGAIPREKGTATAMAPGAVVGVEALLLLLENDDNLGLEECIGRQGGDDDLRVKEEEGSEDVRPKRQRIK